MHLVLRRKIFGGLHLKISKPINSKPTPVIEKKEKTVALKQDRNLHGGIHLSTNYDHKRKISTLRN